MRLVSVAPRFSVILPTFNRLPFLRRALLAWERQEFGIPFELIVVDDGSDDGTRELLAGWTSHRFDLTAITQKNAGPARARNRALENARGDLVFFTGDDIVPSERVLAQHAGVHEEKGRETTVVIGRTVWPDDLPVTATMRHVDGPGAEQFSFAHLRDGEEYDFRHFYTSNLSIRRSFLAGEPDGFSEDFPRAAFEDIELSYRLSRRGQRIFYCREALAWHYHPYDVRSFFRRQVTCGAMAHRLYRKWPLLSKWFLTHDVERLRLRTVAEAAARRGMDASPEDLVRLEEVLFQVAGSQEESPGPDLSPLLGGLFRYGMAKGFVEAAVEDPTRTGVLHLFAREILGPSVRQFLERAGASASSIRPGLVPEIAELLHDSAIEAISGHR